ncbi:MAG: threonine--tRNA ligase [Elusimicrobia bacterium RIFCSPHIGHO2_02_FULL_57_9]|nr:MAG: threonine--tRNA ligase [Elusimicrobia bacterium RIFCSPHIGHO2_02_FULL_57_9]
MSATVGAAKVEASARESLDALRHSCAHVMAQAVTELFPGTKITIGPAIENGFYYDFDSPHHFTLEDLPKIEKRMRQIAEGNHPFFGREISHEEARRYWQKREEPFKIEILDGLKGQKITHYTHDVFTDLCRGGHCDNTKAIRHFKLLSVAGAYWRGDEKNKMLQRIYGTAWPSKQELDAHLARLEEAKKRDHRKLGAELELFTVSENIGPGLALWLPKGALIRSILERYIVDMERALGYQHINTPQLARTKLYKQSGHWEHFKDNMYPPIRFEDKEELVLRPMNCPHHITVYQHKLHSYRELPYRLAELGTMYRYERSGVLSGLSRVRAMTLNDAHIFCLPEQIQSETVGVLKLIAQVYSDFGFKDYWYRLSLRDPKDKVKYVDNDGMWDNAQRCLRQALDEAGAKYEEALGEAAYYGPKIDVQLNDVLGHGETLSTVQLDFYLPERFGLEYVDKDGHRKRPVMIHRGVLSTMERMMAFLIEHYAGNFPLWLSAVQVKILPLTDEQIPAAEALHKRFSAAGLRPAMDLRPEKLGAKVRDAQLEKIPYMVVLGPRDVAAGTLSVRLRDGRQFSGVAESDFISKLTQECAEKATTARWEQV